MAFDTKNVLELEKLASNLRAQIAMHPDCRLERAELKECKRWIALRRLERDPSRAYRARAVVWTQRSAAGTET